MPLYGAQSDGLNLLTANYDKSCSYYEKLLESNPTAIDLMNAAHVKLASGNIKEATALYKNQPVAVLRIFSLHSRQMSRLLRKPVLTDSQ